MTDYVKSTAFTSKDTLPSGNALKILKGAELDTEFNNLAVSSATKADLLSPVFTGTPTAPTASPGTSTTQLATTAFVAASATANTSPTASIMMWPTATAPAGFLLCNGATANRATYAALFAVLGTIYGAGDGSTTFNLPSFNNRSPIGAGGLYTVGQTIGSKDAVVVSHTHTLTDPGHAHAITVPSGGNAAGLTVSSTPFNGSGTTATATTGITIASAGVSGTDANLQPSLGIYFIIKT